MDEFLSIFVTWQFLILCIGISAATFIIRTIIEFFILNNPKLPGNSQSRFWRDLVLVLLPLVLGIVFDFVAKSFPYPDAIVDPYSKFLICISAGLLSTTVYRVIRALLWQKVGITDPEIPVIPPLQPPSPPSV